MNIFAHEAFFEWPHNLSGEIPRRENCGVEVYELFSGSYIQKPILGRRLVIPAAGTVMLLLAAVPLGKDPGTEEEETESDQSGVFKKNKQQQQKQHVCDTAGSSSQFFVPILKYTCPCGRGFHFCHFYYKSSSCGPNQAIFICASCLLFEPCLDNASFPGVGSG